MEYVIQSLSWQFTFYKKDVIPSYGSKRYTLDSTTEGDFEDLKKLVKTSRIRVTPTITELEAILYPKIEIPPTPVMLPFDLIVESSSNMLQVNEEGKLYVKNISTDIEDMKSYIDNYLQTVTSNINQHATLLKSLEETQNHNTTVAQTQLSSVVEQVNSFKETLTSKDKETIVYKETSEVTGPLRIFSTVVNTVSDGVWSVDYSHMKFNTVVAVTVNALNNGTTAAGRRIASINPGYSTTSMSGSLMGATSIGLLAAMSLSSVDGQVIVTVIGT